MHTCMSTPFRAVSCSSSHSPGAAVSKIPQAPCGIFTTQWRQRRAWFWHWECRMNLHLSLRGKLIAVSITSVIIALAVSTFIDAQLAQRAFTQRFQEEVNTLAKELAAGFGGATELDDWQTLTQKIRQIQEARPDIHHLT